MLNFAFRFLIVAVFLISPTLTFSQQTFPDFSPIVEREIRTVVLLTVFKPESGPSFQDMLPRTSPIPPNGIPKEEKRPDKELSAPPQQEGSGSGIIIRSDGYIITNAHVVADAKDIIVKLYNKRQYKAKVVGSDPRGDIAVIKIDATNLPVAKIGNPNDMKVGQTVIGIGAPFSFAFTVTSGIISAKDRALPNNPFTRFIQTDADINPGNSGGPLINLNGEVIAINAEIFSRTGASIGLAFAIPIDTAMDVALQLINNGKIVRGRIGVQVKNLTDEEANALNLSDPAGAFVSDVTANSPAFKAGIKLGDVIVAIGDKKIEESIDLTFIIGGTKPGTETSITVIRNGSPIVLKIVIGELK